MDNFNSDICQSDDIIYPCIFLPVQSILMKLRHLMPSDSHWPLGQIKLANYTNGNGIVLVLYNKYRS